MRASLLVALALVACNKAAPDFERSGCDPLDPSLCALPWPSSYFLEEADTPSGYQVAFGDESLPENRDNVQTKPTYINEKDGFSTMGSALTYFEDVSLEGVALHTDLDASLAADSKTILLNTVTGEPHPHYVELDMSPEDPNERLLMIRPATPLDFGTRYVVAMRGLVKNSGGPVDVSSAFAKLRDGEESPNPDVEFRRAHFEENVFGPLEAAGWGRDELQLAWDFVTVTRETSLSKMDWIRDDLLDFVGSDGPDYTITSVERDDCNAGAKIGLTLYGDMEVPLYTDIDGPGAFLTRDEAGMPFRNGTTSKEFMVRVPCSVISADQPATVVQYGHGLLGDISEARTGWLSDYADREQFIVVATNWTGMSEDDAPPIALMIVEDVSNFAQVPERSHQGFAEFHALTRLIRGGLVDEPELQGTGGSLIDPDDVGFYGISQGAILGMAFMAQSKDLTRGVFGVGGGPYEVLLTRSNDFGPFFLLFKEKFTDERDITLLISMMQTLWDPAEGAGWLQDLAGDAPEGVPDKQLLMQVGIYDAQVTTLGAQIEARAVGAKLVAPATRPVWGMTEEQPGFSGSAYVEFKYNDTPDEPVDTTPPDADFDSHECPRREPAGQLQVIDFLRTGVVNHYCDGICDDSLQGELCN